MPSCLLALGANLGDCRQSIEAALNAVGELAGTKLVAQSRVHSTEAIGGPAGQGKFANAVAVVDTSLSAIEMLEAFLAIETNLGRQREQRWSARTIDIDLLLYEQQRVESPRLVVPHPRMSFRPFVLEPAVEVAENWLHPLLGMTLGQLHSRLKLGTDTVEIYGAAQGDRDWLAGWLKQNAPQLEVVSSSSQSKLTVGFCLPDEPMRPGGPTLRMPAGSREKSLFEVEAAVECVWPGLQGGPSSPPSQSR